MRLTMCMQGKRSAITYSYQPYFTYSHMIHSSTSHNSLIANRQTNARDKYVDTSPQKTCKALFIPLVFDNARCKSARPPTSASPICWSSMWWPGENVASNTGPNMYKVSLRPLPASTLTQDSFYITPLLWLLPRRHQHLSQDHQTCLGHEYA